MAKIIRTEVRKRGVIGHICKWLFIGFNVLMIWGVVKGLANVGDQASHYATQDHKNAAAMGAAIGIGVLLPVWAAADIVLGALVYFTRGKVSYIEERID